MPITVEYDNYELKDLTELKERYKQSDQLEIEALTLKSFVRDISWGTGEEKLIAVENLITPKEIDSLEPVIMGMYSAQQDKKFSVQFKDDIFNLNTEGIDHLIGTIAGDVLLYSNFKSISVKDIDFSDSSQKTFFSGPNIGVDSLRKSFFNDTLKGSNRPIVAFSVKPRMGQTIDVYKKIYEEACKGKIDLIEDDERLIDPVYCRFEDRVDVMAELQEKYGTKFSVNITGALPNMLVRLKYAFNKGIRFVKVDPLVTGFDSLRYVSKMIKSCYKNNIAITCYPDANGMYRCLSRELILKLTRLCGGDIIYTATPQWARMDDAYTTQKYMRNIGDIEKKYKLHKILLEDINGLGLKSSLPTISNGCDICSAEMIQFIYRNNYSHENFGFYVGGGIANFPAKLDEAVKEWMGCCKYTSSKKRKDYTNYNYKYRNQMEQAGINLFQIDKEMGK